MERLVADSGGDRSVLGLTLGLFVLMRRWERQEEQAELVYASKHIVEAIRRATERIQLTHEFMRQDYYGSPSVSREEFSCAPSRFLPTCRR